MPLQYLFSPWLAPPDIQEIANCRIGTDYPSPILNHKEARVENIKNIEQLNASFADLNLWNTSSTCCSNIVQNKCKAVPPT